MEEVVIRLYKNSDRSEIIKLWHNVLLDVFQNDPNINEETVENIPDTYGDDFLIAETDNRVTGTIGYIKEGSNARLKRMYVNKKYHGLGVATRLYEEMEKKMKSNNITKIILSTYPQMERAIVFYRKKGFQEFKKDGEQIHMTKDLKVQ